MVLQVAVKTGCAVQPVCCLNMQCKRITAKGLLRKLCSELTWLQLLQVLFDPWTSSSASSPAHMNKAEGKLGLERRSQQADSQLQGSKQKQAGS